MFKILLRLKKTLAIAAMSIFVFSPIEIDHQQEFAYAAESNISVNQEVIAKTENGQIRGFTENGLIIIVEFHMPSRR